jgi:2-polyprenyl-3-methyl-5-hydroxy-6-metoxy-1,4-benzoquinol methylase
MQEGIAARAQYTVDWDARFRLGDTPWEDEGVPPSTIELISEHVQPNSAILELGCGRGTTAIWLAAQGYRLTACDVSAEAVRQARQRADLAGVRVRFMTNRTVGRTRTGASLNYHFVDRRRIRGSPSCRHCSSMGTYCAS